MSFAAARQFVGFLRLGHNVELISQDFENAAISIVRAEKVSWNTAIFMIRADVLRDYHARDCAREIHIQFLVKMLYLITQLPRF
jgi:hypothetical protein